MNRETRHGQLARVLALEGTALAGRIGIADVQISAAFSPLRSTPTENTRGGASTNPDAPDPLEHTLTEYAHAREARRRFNDAMRQWAEAMSDLSVLCSEWAAVAPVKVGWCSNPNHTTNEPRHGKGSLCSFCERIKGDYGRLPNRELLDRASRTTKLGTEQIRRLLKLGNDGSAA